MTARAKPQAAEAEISFEVYVECSGRWLLEDVFDEQRAALDHAERLRQRRDVDGIRVVRETYDPKRDERSERVIFDTAFDLPRPAPAPETRQRPRPKEPAAPARKRFPWVMASFSGLGLLATLVGALVATVP